MQEPQPEPTLGQTIGAAFERENLIASFFSSRSVRSPFEEVEPGFDVFALANPRKPHNAASNPFIYLDGMDREPDAIRRFIGARNPQHALDIAADIRRERRNNEILSRSGWTGTIMSIAAGVADPLIFVPAVGVVRGAKGGISVARSAAASAMLGGGAVATQELGFQMTQADRPASESAMRVTGGVLLSGLLGAAFSGMSKGAHALATRELEEAVIPKSTEVIDMAASSSAGAIDSASNDIKLAKPIIADPVDISSKVGMEETERFMSLRRDVDRKIRELDEGRITDEKFTEDISEIRERDKAILEKKRDELLGKDRVRGSHFVIEKLNQAARRGELPEGAAEFATWLINENPHLANGLAIGIRAPKSDENLALGTYASYGRLINIFKGATDSDVAVHEILHHTERMMPKDIQDAIVGEWRKRLESELHRAVRSGNKDRAKVLGEMLSGRDSIETFNRAMDKGHLSFDDYQYFNSSEFWAINATEMLSNRYVAGNIGWITKARDWLNRMVQTARSLFGMQSDSALLRGLESVIHGTGEFQSKRMLTDQYKRSRLGKSPPSIQFSIKPSGEEIKVKGAMGLEHGLKWLSPRLSGFLSQSPIMRGITNKMLIAPMALEKGANVAPVEARTALAYAHYSRALEAQDAIYAQMISGGKQTAPTIGQKLLGFGRKQGVMSRGEFSQQVSAAMRRSGTDAFERFPDPVKKAAAVYMEMQEKYAKRAVEIGLLPEEVLKQPGYLRRLYNLELLASSKAEQESMAQSIAAAFLAKAEAQGVELTDEGALVRAKKAVDTILTSDPTRTLPVDIAKRGPFIERTLDVPDEAIERWLINDADRVMKNYIRTMAADTEIAASFGLGRARETMKASREKLVEQIAAAEAKNEGKGINALIRERDNAIAAKFGGDKLRRAFASSRKGLKSAIKKGETLKALEERDDQIISRFNTGDGRLAIDKIESHWRPLIKEAQRSDRRAAAKMTKKMLKDRELFRNYRDELRGMLGVPADPTAITPRIMKAVRQWTFMALGGNIMLSSINDIALPIFNYGVGDVFGSMSEAFFADGAAVIRKMALEDARDTLGATEIILNTHVNKLWDIADGVVPATKFERGMEEATKIYSAVSLISPWTQATKDISAINAQGFIMRTAQKVSKEQKISKGRAARIRELGLNDDDLRVFHEQWLKYGEEDGYRGVIAPHTSAWADRAAAEKLKLAVIKARTFDVIGGTALDRPIIPGVSQDLSRLLFQFSSYGLNVGTRVAGRAIQYRDAQAATGVMAMMGLSMLAVMLKDKIAGKERDFKNLTAEAVRQSPATGLLFDTSKYIEFATRGKIGIAPLLDLQSGNRYYSADTVLSAMLGPSIGVGQNMAQSLGDAVDLDLDPGTIGRIRRSVPLNNLFYFRRLFDSLQDKAKEAVK